MIEYRVVDLSRDGKLAALLDADRGLHVVRLQGCSLLHDQFLVGRKAKLGAHKLLAEGLHMPLCVRFIAVDCSQDETLALMHPCGEAAAGHRLTFATTQTGTTDERTAVCTP